MENSNADQPSNYWLSLLKRRIVASGQNSLAGLVSCFKSEEAFRIEVIVGALLTPIAFWLAATPVEFLLLVSTIVLVLITELLNSAVEATVDRVGLDYHDLAKQAKDIGSAAVFMSMLLLAVVWLTLIIF